MLHPSQLARFYEPEEAEALLLIHHLREKHRDPFELAEAQKAAIATLWPNFWTRLQKTSWITLKVAGREGGTGLLRINYAQQMVRDAVQSCWDRNVPCRIIILKARQLGFSTLVQALFYAIIMWQEQTRSLVVSYDKDITQDLFRKTKRIMNSYPVQYPRGESSDSKGYHEFADPHGGGFYLRTAGKADNTRGLQIHLAHLSEIPMWPNPQEAMGALGQCVPTMPGTINIWESTAKGAWGSFYEKWNQAVNRQNTFIPVFAPWFLDPGYSLAFETTSHRNLFLRGLSRDDQRYMEKHSLTPEQMWWREMKTMDDLEGSRLFFRQEYPATADEAFLTSGAPVFNQDAVASLRARVAVPFWTGGIQLREVPA